MKYSGKGAVNSIYSLVWGELIPELLHEVPDLQDERILCRTVDIISISDDLYLPCVHGSDESDLFPIHSINICHQVFNQAIICCCVFPVLYINSHYLAVSGCLLLAFPLSRCLSLMYYIRLPDIFL